MQKIIVAILVVMAAVFVARRFCGFMAQARGNTGGCGGHCGCSDKSKK
ncbi:MAG: hypothetical protein J0M12_10750 [Deltaproteobacteria bacterium]|nr:hypothetical protein [Deltaproteobacteria bacterium]